MRLPKLCRNPISAHTYPCQRVYSPKQLNKIANESRTLAEADLPACLATLRKTMQKLVGDTGESPDKIAKGRQFVEAIFDTADFD